VITRLPAWSARPADLLEPLETTGLVVLESLLTADELHAVQRVVRGLIDEAPYGNTEFDGLRTKRIFDPLVRTRILDDLVRHPMLMGAVEARIGPAQLGMTVLSEVGPGEVGQRPHRDGAVYPLPPDFGPVMLNAIWAIDNFTTANGATVAVPESHREDRRAPGSGEWVGATSVAMPAGSVLLYDGRLVHGAGVNKTDAGRTGFIVEYVARWLRPNENHTLAVPVETARGLPRDLRELLGYNQLGAHLGFVSGRPPDEWLEQH
jgi:hypothetical protein